MDNQPHILIVEDEASIIEVLVATLETCYRVSSVCTVADAIAILRTSHIDLALVDHGLPDGRGSEVADVATELGAAVIEMSGHPRSMDVLDLSSNFRLFKPFRLQELLSTLELALQGEGRQPQLAD